MSSAAAVDLGLVGRLRLPEHRRGVHGRAPGRGEQLGRAQEAAAAPRPARPLSCAAAAASIARPRSREALCHSARTWAWSCGHRLRGVARRAPRAPRSGAGCGRTLAMSASRVLSSARSAAGCVGLHGLVDGRRHAAMLPKAKSLVTKSVRSHQVETLFVTSDFAFGGIRSVRRP